MSKPDPIEIKSVEHVQDYKIRLKFNDGKEKVVDFGPFLRSAPKSDDKEIPKH